MKKMMIIPIIACLAVAFLAISLDAASRQPKIQYPPATLSAFNDTGLSEWLFNGNPPQISCYNERSLTKLAKPDINLTLNHVENQTLKNNSQSNKEANISKVIIVNAKKLENSPQIIFKGRICSIGNISLEIDNLEDYLKHRYQKGKVYSIVYCDSTNVPKKDDHPPSWARNGWGGRDGDEGTEDEDGDTREDTHRSHDDAQNLTYNDTANIPQNLTGNLTNYTANMPQTQNLTGNITSNLTQNPSSNMTDSLTANYTANLSQNLTDNITTNLTTNVTENFTENVTTNFTTNLSLNMTDNITTNYTTNITQNLTDNITTNYTANISQNLTDNLTANLTTNVTQNLTDNTTINCSASLQQEEINSTSAGTLSAWALNGDNDASIVFDRGTIPANPQNLSFCFYLYDNDWAQENELQFRINDKSIYNIIDDSLLPTGTWIWKCAQADPSDFSDSYSISLWYSNRSAAGGIFIANNNAAPGISSSFDTTALNAPETLDSNITWSSLSGLNWMVNAQVLSAGVNCLNETQNLTLNLTNQTNATQNLTINLTNQTNATQNLTINLSNGTNVTQNLGNLTSAISILSPLNGATLNTTTIGILASLPTNVSSWGVSFDDGPNITACANGPPEDANINFTSGAMSATWNMNGNNDGKIIFENSVLPKGRHMNVSFCFYLYDSDWAQENQFQFRVNDKGVYSINDDESMPSGAWTWKCAQIDPSDFAGSYGVSFWYSNRSDVGGLYIGNDNAVAGSSSYWESTPLNPPNAKDADIIWNAYGSNIDWMVNAHITTAETSCSETGSFAYTLPFGTHKMAAFYNKQGTSETSMPVNFEIIGIGNINIYPKSIMLGNKVDITAAVYSANIAKVEAIIIPQGGSLTMIAMFDDGLHEDGLAGDNLYGVTYEPTGQAPYIVDISLTTNDNTVVHKSVPFEVHKIRIAVLSSETTMAASSNATIPTQIEYIEGLTSMQHELAMAGIPFDMIGEDDLKDMNVLRQYDVIVLPSFKNVKAADRDIIITTLETAIKKYGIGILAFGDFMAKNENNSAFSYGAGQAPMNRILNAKVGTKSGDGNLQLKVANSSHPSAWRFSQNEVILAINGGSYSEILANNPQERYDYPYRTYYNGNSYSTEIIASTNGLGKAFYSLHPRYISQTALGRDAILWILYADQPHFGIKMTDKSALFTARVDADVSFDTTKTISAIQTYSNFTGKAGLLGGWYIVNKHSDGAIIAWDQLADDYQSLINANHEIGSHSWTHPVDMNLLNDSEVYRQMRDSKEDIDSHLALDIKGFANPGEPPTQFRLWKIAQDSGYAYFSPLDSENTKGFGYIADDLPIVNLQQNIRADYELVYELNMTVPQALAIWENQYNEYYRWGDGILIFSIWHDYAMFDYPDLFKGFADYVNATDIEAVTPIDAVNRFLVWNRQGFNIMKGQGSKTWLITRTTPDARYGQITLPPGTGIASIAGASGLKATKDGKSYTFAFENSTVAITTT